MHSFTEENYIKAIYKLSDGGNREVNTNAIADALDTKAASVTDMLRKLSAKGIADYVKYRGVTLTGKGERVALQIIRKHRLWEVFLVEKLKFNWDEVHDMAEELEHINSDLLIRRLDEFLGYPKFDPHGDPIPTEDGEMNTKQQCLLADLEVNSSGTVVGVNDSQPLFLQYLDKMGIFLGAKIKVIDKIPYDNSLEINLENKKNLVVSSEVARNIFLSA
ncbi:MULTISPECIES: metal-dependent transcriptional regulator [Pontibacter]|uniref:Transcriptional regulator MntR n=1 Tax=Pontibacter lucknowensis TaxID=1077936 RepID=A0A1N6WJZ9_9BACT|nr:MULTISPECIES: metal-dependent transcriptional regulator [Pontibacter]EJF08862.1 Mn-dependent transcriptional regulator [Pontibacter sp. BAB1700]SIQ90417.1 iron (metal) dependent repressor, DtxR family [Pontibacter lucknowensis]